MKFLNPEFLNPVEFLNPTLFSRAGGQAKLRFEARLQEQASKLQEPGLQARIWS